MDKFNNDRAQTVVVIIRATDEQHQMICLNISLVQSFLADIHTGIFKKKFDNGFGGFIRMQAVGIYCYP